MEISPLDETVEIYKAKILPSDATSKYFKPKRVAAYCRVSRNLDMQQSSLETQIESYERIISEHLDWQLVEIYYDKGISGTCAAKRPGFMRMIEDCKAGKIDMIIAKSISRFARNTVDTLEYTRLLRGLGVSVYFEAERVETTELFSEMLLTVYAAFAQEESHSISENTRRGFRQRFQMGIAKYTKTFGYTCDKDDKNLWHIKEDEAEIIKELFNRYLYGEKIPDICNDFNEKGIASPNGKMWYQSTAAKLLKNEKYVGDVTMQKTIVTDLLNHVSKPNDGIVPIYKKKNHHPAIVSREDFNIVQRMLQLKNTLTGSQQYPYYDFLRCPRCGKPLVQYMTNLTSTPTAWICSDHKNCSNRFVLTKFIDRAVKDAINDLPQCVTGYEEPIRLVKEHLGNGGDIELYHLVKLVEKIELDEEFEIIKIAFKFGKEVTTKIEFSRPSEHPNPIVEYKNNELYVNGVYCAPLIGKRVCESINKVRVFNENLEIIKPEDGDGIYRVNNSLNSRSRWRRKVDESISNQANKPKEESCGILPSINNQRGAGGILRVSSRLLYPKDKQ